MAKPILPKGLAPSMPVGRMAQLFIGAKLKELTRFAPEAVEGEVEGVHDMRVASKRLREALRLFRPLLPRKRCRRLMPLVEELNDALGRVRDPDVLSEHAAALAEEVPEAAALLLGLRGTWAEDRSSAHADLVALWQRMTRSAHLPRRLRELAVATGRRSREISATVTERFAYLCITERSQRVAEGLVQFRQYGDPAALHRLRILIKRLKYTLEPFLPVLPALDGPHQRVSDAQEALGLTHDYDVLQSAMADFFRQSRTQRSRAACQALEAAARHREEHFAAAQEQIGLLESADWQAALLDAVD